MNKNWLSANQFHIRFICFLTIFTVGMGAVILAGGIKNCPAEERVVTVYCALDQVYAEPILREFEQKTGIKVRAKFDVEAVKTVGLVNALVAEQAHPRCDVLWNNEVMHTVILKNMGLLAPYRSAAASTIPEQFRDPQGFWTGMAARARVIIYNKKRLKPGEAPQGLEDFLNPRRRGKGAIALPLFGTTATHAAALFSLWGPEKGRAFFEGLKKNDIVVAAGNARVRDLVASGELAFGLTDTDDAHVAFLAGSPTDIIYPDQEGVGTLVLPCTVSLIKGCPHLEEAKILIDELLSPGVEEKLAWGRSAQIPLHSNVSKPPYVPDLKRLKVMEVKFKDLAKIYPWSSDAIKAIFLK
jgi:iron(III) transport system substrate-binding protein